MKDLLLNIKMNLKKGRDSMSNIDILIEMKKELRKELIKNKNGKNILMEELIKCEDIETYKNLVGQLGNFMKEIKEIKFKLGELEEF